MMSVWMLYSVAVALLLGLAALAAERVCLARGRPTRWVWLAALALSLVAPAILSRSAPGGSEGGVEAGVAAARATSAEPAGVIGRAASEPGFSLSRLDRVLGIGWIAGSTVFGVVVLLSAITLERNRRNWRVGSVAGRTVRVSARTGPAVAGFLWPEVVLPERVLAWDAESQRLLVEHENEHEQAGDAHLLLASLVGLLLMPWNPALWWQARRLRFAIEVDCDARVLRLCPCVQTYGRLLIEVARASSPGLVPVAAFSPSRSFLERRIRILARPVRAPGRPAHAALWALIVLPPVAVVSFPAPGPPDLGGFAVGSSVAQPPSDGDVDALPGSGAGAPPGFGSEPTFTSIEVRPELRNAVELATALTSALANAAPQTTSSDTVVFWALVDAGGSVRNTRIVSSSGVLALDRAAREALHETARFTPAREGGDRVAAWIQVPLTMGGQAGTESVRIPIATTPIPAPPASAHGAVALGGSASSASRMRDPDAFARLVGRHYPAELRRAGIAGTVTMWVYVDAAGTVRSARLAATSGNEQLDLIAREVVLEARFAPGHGGREVGPSWIQVPVAFSPR